MSEVRTDPPQLFSLTSRFIFRFRRPVTFSEFVALVEGNPSGGVLLEGRRTIPAPAAAAARALAEMLATTFPQLRFRSGNATGSDEAFSRGIAAVDPHRLEIIAPYASHRAKSRIAGAQYSSPAALTAEQELDIENKTTAASPTIKGLIAARSKGGRLGAKVAILIRDTMKVTGFGPEFSRPICALFYIDPADPMAGGTGHTIRVCQQEGVPYAFQESWSAWIRERR